MKKMEQKGTADGKRNEGMGGAAGSTMRGANVAEREGDIRYDNKELTARTTTGSEDKDGKRGGERGESANGTGEGAC